MEELQARMGATQAALEALERLDEEGGGSVSEDTRRRLGELYEELRGNRRIGAR